MKNNIFKNKKILITGATGSVGTALIKELIRNYNFKVIRAMCNNEHGLFLLKSIINKNYSSFEKLTRVQKIRLIHGDIRSKERCMEVSKDIDIVIHAAAMKHVDICEYNPQEAIATNVLGTENIVNASIKNNIQKFVFISTDKAVSPNTIMGTSKLMAEKIVINANYSPSREKQSFHVIRFGNVIGSRGSVLEVFKNQVKKNLDLTITHKKMTRFFMNLNDAAKKIIKSFTICRGGEIFAIRSMYSFKIQDLAESLIKYHKTKNKLKSKIIYIGIKKNEKLYEELLTLEEYENAIQTKDFFISKENLKTISSKKFYKGFKIDNFSKLSSKTVKLLNRDEILNYLHKQNLL
jgi:UDP-N-acetylglucosamine 4,6-dehydratase/5-epimerase